MIRRGNSKIIAMYLNGQKILSVYTQGQLVWPEQGEEIIDKILSCFSNGYWIDEYPWTDEIPWTDKIRNNGDI